MAPPTIPVPETLLKKRKREEGWAAKKAEERAELQKKHNSKQKEIVKRAHKYIKEYRAQVGGDLSAGLVLQIGRVNRIDSELEGDAILCRVVAGGIA